MKIAVLQDDFPPHHEGGSGVIAHQLSREYVRRGHEVLVISAVDSPELSGISRVDGMRVARVYSKYHVRWRAYRSLYNPSVVGQIDALLKDFQPDAVHVHNVHSQLSYYAIIIARRYTRDVYMTAHDAMSFHFGKLRSAADTPDFSEADTYFESPWRQIKAYRIRYNPFRTMVIHRILTHNVRRVLAVSDALKRALMANGIRHVDVIHNGIDVGEWGKPADVDEFKKVHGIGNAAILFGGRLSAMKGAYKALDSLRLVRNEVPHAQLLIIGKKEAHTEPMIDYARKEGIEEGLVFTGWVTGSALRAAYHAAAVVAVPSLYLDPFPTINLEAFACGKPVVATCFGGSREIVEDGVSGFIVDPLDAQMMATRLSELLQDKAKNASFGHAGYERVTKGFSLEVQAEKYLRVFADGPGA